MKKGNPVGDQCEGVKGGSEVVNSNFYGTSGTYPICDSSVEFVHIDSCINSMACMVQKSRWIWAG